MAWTDHWSQTVFVLTFDLGFPGQGRRGVHSRPGQREGEALVRILGIDFVFPPRAQANTDVLVCALAALGAGLS